MLKTAPVIDGNLSEWKKQAYSDGTWNLERVQQSEWYEPKRNRLTVEESEDTTAIDLEAQYFISWDQQYVYLGAEVKDNANDVVDAKHEPKRWYYKDAIAWFLEIPSDTMAETFGQGDHAFCFVIDTLRPDYGAWWRHGSATQSYIEEAIPVNVVEYSIRMNPWQRSEADYVLEARIDMQLLIGDDSEAVMKADDVWRMMIVHCDPDGGNYGGHLLIHGKGDKDSTWGEIQLTDSVHE